MAEKTVRDWLRDARLDYDHNRYDDALECYKKALELDPDNKRALCGLGRVYGAKGAYSKSFEYFRKVLQDSPNSVGAWNGKADTYTHMGDFQNAIECHKRALKINSANRYAQKGIAIINRKLKNYEKAIEGFEKILSEQKSRRERKGLTGLFLDDKGIWYSLGITYEEMENYGKAIESYEKALEIDPHDFNIWDEVGELYAKSGNQEKAKYCHSKGKSKFFKELSDHLNRGFAKAEPKSSSEWLKEGDKYYEEKNYKQAFRSYEKAIDLTPSREEGWIKMGDTFRKLNNPERAIECYEQAISLNPELKKIVNQLERMKSN